MLVPNQIVNIRVNGRNAKHFKDLGYEIPMRIDKYNKEKYDFDKFISVKAEDLMVGSRSEVNVVCDFCGEIVIKTYRRYNLEHTYNLDCCKDCFMNKIKITSTEKYGVDHPLKSGIVKEKRFKTNIERYGGITPTKSKEVIEKIIKTNMKRYGVKSPAKLDSVKEKIKNTCLERYSAECPSKNKDIQEKMTNTCLERYGVKQPAQNKEVFDKFKKTNKERYGTEYYSSTKECRDKVAKTNLKRYGYKCPLQSPSIREKSNITRLKNKTFKISSQQTELYNMIQKRYPDAILNYPFDKCTLDIAIILDDNLKIDIEYDGWYWHQDQIKDKRRNSFLINKGWKVLRVKSANKLPDNDDLFESIDYLINTNHSLKEIILNDWGYISKQD